MTMLRLTGKRTSRISNRLAIFAALLLVVTSLAGVSNSALLTDGGESAMASSANQKSQPVKLHSKGFKVSLFLFRSNR
jgi:hypothetical protein